MNNPYKITLIRKGFSTKDYYQPDNENFILCGNGVMKYFEINADKIEVEVSNNKFPDSHHCMYSTIEDVLFIDERTYGPGLTYAAETILRQLEIDLDSFYFKITPVV